MKDRHKTIAFFTAVGLVVSLGLAGFLSGAAIFAINVLSTNYAGIAASSLLLSVSSILLTAIYIWLTL